MVGGTYQGVAQLQQEFSPDFKTQIPLRRSFRNIYTVIREQHGVGQSTSPPLWFTVLVVGLVLVQWLGCRLVCKPKVGSASRPLSLPSCGVRLDILGNIPLLFSFCGDLSGVAIFPGYTVIIGNTASQGLMHDHIQKCIFIYSIILYSDNILPIYYSLASLINILYRELYVVIYNLCLELVLMIRKS